MYRANRFLIAALALSISLAATTPAKALRVALPADVPAAMQAINAETVVIGKVLEIEAESTQATPFPAAATKTEFQIAVIKIEQGLLGAKGVTTVRVGFPKGAVAGPPRSNVPRRPQLANESQAVALVADQEGCFFLTKHHDGDFYVMQPFARPLDKKAPDYAKQVDSVKKLLKVYEDPKTALQAKNAADRGYAASALVQKYRRVPQVTKPNAKVVQEPIDADENKMILTALSEMDWSKVDPNGGPSLQTTFYQLGLQPKDGWVQPKVQQGKDYNKIMAESVAKWLKENSDKYRIQRQVVK